MLAYGEKPDGSDDVAVFTGTAEWDGKHLLMRRRPDGSTFQLADEWLACSPRSKVPALPA